MVTSEDGQHSFVVQEQMRCSFTRSIGDAPGPEVVDAVIGEVSPFLLVRIDTPEIEDLFTFATHSLRVRGKGVFIGNEWHVRDMVAGSTGSVQIHNLVYAPEEKSLLAFWDTGASGAAALFGECEDV